MTKLSIAVVKILVIVSMMLAVFQPAFALTCDRVHRTLNPFSPEARVERTTFVADQNQQAFTSHIESGGGFHVVERSLSPKHQRAVVELVQMVSKTRSVKFSFKDFEGKESGRLVLGIPLRSGYTLEVSYRSNYTNGERVFTADKLILVTPTAQREVVSNHILQKEGGFINKVNFDLTDYPALNGHDFTLFIPENINGKALYIFEQSIAKKLDLFDKDQLWALTKSNNYYYMRSALFLKAFKEKVIEYHIKGVFKTYVKWIVVPAIALVGLWQANTHYAYEKQQAMQFIQYQINGPEYAWVKKSVEQFIDAPHTPSAVKDQIKSLYADFEMKTQDTNVINDLAKVRQQNPPDLMQPDKFQVSKEQYMWVSTQKDQTTGQTSTLLFIIQMNKYGAAETLVLPLDRTKYATLISFLEARGQFSPLQGVP